jgi:hypothetical protein
MLRLCVLSQQLLVDRIVWNVNVRFSVPLCVWIDDGKEEVEELVSLIQNMDHCFFSYLFQVLKTNKFYVVKLNCWVQSQLLCSWFWRKTRNKKENKFAYYSSSGMNEDRLSQQQQLARFFDLKWIFDHRAARWIIIIAAYSISALSNVI